MDACANEALPLLDQAGDHACLSHVWAAFGWGVANVRGEYAEWTRAAGEALRHARLAGQRPTHLFFLEVALVVGPMPADEALETLDAALQDVPHASALVVRSDLPGDARPLRGGMAERARRERSAPGARRRPAGSRGVHPCGDRGAEGNYALAAQYMQDYCDFLSEHGQHALLSTFAPWLGRFLCALGRFDDAEPRAEMGRELGDEHDVLSQSLWRQVQARVDSHRGRRENAEAPRARPLR